MTRFRIAGLLLASLAWGVSGCGSRSPADSGPPPGLYGNWQGATSEEVEQRLGPPNAKGMLPSGDTVLIYRWSRTQSVGGYTTAGGSLYTGSNVAMGRQYVPMQRLDLNCNVAFTIGRDDRVKNVDLEGNACFDEAK
jgi:hypothetical protein